MLPRFQKADPINLIENESMENLSRRPLEGVKVVEIARILAGPWCGQVLADLGATVIKIESPHGDDTRQWGPPFVEREDDTTAAYFYSCNRGKSSVTADFREPDDLAHVKRLIADCDVLIENFKVGGLANFGLDYVTLAKLHPALIYCSVTGFGQTGPRATQPGYDLLIQGMSGIMDITGDPDGPPQKMGVAFADIFSGLYAAIAIEAALLQRERTGRGHHIDISLFDSMLGVLANQAMNYFATGKNPKRRGNQHANLTPYETITASDGHLIIAVGNDRQFQALTKVLNLETQLSDERFDTNTLRLSHQKELMEIINAATKKITRVDLIARFTAANVPAGPINSVAEAMDDPQAIHRDMAISPEGQSGLRTPIILSGRAMQSETSAPVLGGRIDHEINW